MVATALSDAAHLTWQLRRALLAARRGSQRRAVRVRRSANKRCFSLARARTRRAGTETGCVRSDVDDQLGEEEDNLPDRAAAMVTAVVAFFRATQPLAATVDGVHEHTVCTWCTSSQQLLCDGVDV